MIWDPAVESAPRERLAGIQLTRLKSTIRHLLEHSRVLGPRLRSAGVSDARDITTLEDLTRLPFTTREDFQDHYPLGMLAVPETAVVRIHASSGTHGRPKIVAYTRADLNVWGEVVARSLALAGTLPGMRVHNAYGYGLFTGGLGLHQGAERMGVSGHPDVGRLHAAPGHAAAGSERPGAVLHAELRAVDRRSR